MKTFIAGVVCAASIAGPMLVTCGLHPNASDGYDKFQETQAREINEQPPDNGQVPQARIPKGPREFEGIWFQAWLSSAEGGRSGFECTTQADICLTDFRNRFRIPR